MKFRAVASLVKTSIENAEVKIAGEALDFLLIENIASSKLTRGNNL